MITVFYVSDDAPRDARSALRMYENEGTTVADTVFDAVEKGYYRPMAEVECDSVEQAWTLMQNGVRTSSWTLDPPAGLTPLAGPMVIRGKTYGNRSADLGDVFVLDGKAFVCMAVGFAEVPGLSMIAVKTTYPEDFTGEKKPTRPTLIRKM